MIMQEIETDDPGTSIRILGVNQVGQESGNATACVGKVLPWLQETADHPVWVPWGVTYRDVVILDSRNRQVGTYNLTEHDLSDPGNRLVLKAMLQAAVGAR